MKPHICFNLLFNSSWKYVCLVLGASTDCIGIPAIAEVGDKNDRYYPESNKYTNCCP